MKASMTNFDIYAIINELIYRLRGSELKNIFEFNDKFFFRFRTKKEGTQILVIDPGKSIYISKYKREFPPSPSGLCKVFRIHIKGKWLKDIYQYDFDRICVLEFEAHEKVYTLIIELFSKGNIILLSPENKIYVAKNYKKMRDRDIHPGIVFQFPPSSGKNFLEAELDWVKNQLEERKEKDIVTLVSRTLNIGKLYAEEVCLLGKVDLATKPDDINDKTIKQIISGVKKLRETIQADKLEAKHYFDEKTSELIDITPFPLQVYNNHKEVAQESFSVALDEYFSTVDVDKISSKELSAEGKKIKHLEEVRRKQEDHLKEMDKQANVEKEKGNLIYQYLGELDELIQTITDARRKNVSWSEIKEKLDAAKENKMKGARLLKKIHEKNKNVVVTLDGKDVTLDFLKSASDNANDMYKKAKKAESKKPGAQKKIDELSDRIKKLELGLEELAKKETIMLETRKREWFEKFHWFKSSDGFLVLAGKDLRSNNNLVKKYLEKDDLFLHADVHGAAVVIIKADGKEIPQTTIDEAASFSVIYSKAWKDRLSSQDTFWVTADQVSFSAPSGEYLAKGSFIIKGSKNILKNVPLEIAVAAVIEEKWAYTIGGPLNAIKRNDTIDQSKIITLVPGDTIKSQMAKTIVNKFVENLNDNDTAKIKATVLNDLISILPGNSFIKKE
ncbi:MAG: fibronectin-binding domain-containing protein [Asgard group archaeon]|nr:fibronectin-binding domain-containing protein [Asgard group archaeon]